MVYFQQYLIRQEEDLQAIEVRLAQLPKGCMVADGPYLFHKYKNTKVSISDNIDMQRLLCQKAILKKIKQVLDFNRRLKFAQFQQRKKYNMLALIISLAKAYADCPFAHFYHPNAHQFEARNWQTNPYPFDHTPILSNGGRVVRSLGEVNFVNLLETYPLIFQVDVAFKLGGRIIYPDFIVMEPIMCRLFIGEYFGLAGTAGYDEKMARKMEDYRNNGFELGVNLFFLFPEDVKNPMVMRNIIEGLILGGNF